MALTAFYLKEHGIPIKGILFNRYIPGDLMHEDNVRMCEYLTGVKVVARIPEGATELPMSPKDLTTLFDHIKED